MTHSIIYIKKTDSCPELGQTYTRSALVGARELLPMVASEAMLQFTFSIQATTKPRFFITLKRILSIISTLLSSRTQRRGDGEMERDNIPVYLPVHSVVTPKSDWHRNLVLVSNNHFFSR